MTKSILPPGTWKTQLSAEKVAKSSPKLGEPQLVGERLYWLESLPQEKGRITIMMHEHGGTKSLLPHPISARSRVHEYGGGSYFVRGNLVYFVLADDQQIYHFDVNQSRFEPIAVTQSVNARYADLCVSNCGKWLFAVKEIHSASAHEPENQLIAIDLTDRQHPKENVIHQGQDFYAYPRMSPDSQQLCWISWNHPNMPWDNTQLWLQDLVEQPIAENRPQLEKAFVGNGKESLLQPKWSPTGELFVVSDRDNWWNIYRVKAGQLEPITQQQAEFTTPLWTFNMSTYAFIDANKFIATFVENGHWKLAEFDFIEKPPAALNLIHTDFSLITGVTADPDTQHFAFVGASATQSPQICRALNASTTIDTITSHPQVCAKQGISVAQAITFETSDNQTAYGFYYPPLNEDIETDELPPLIAICHGGPTGATNTALNLKVQYWTQRGFAVVDVDYRGSTGYGRKYRHALNKKWGLYDVDDVCAAVKYCVNNNLAAPEKIAIRGSSAGGFTVLAALTFENTFTCGTSLYGIGDLSLLATDTHKFEARYLDHLIGDFTHDKADYENRSPINHTDKLNCPLLLLQGLEDKVVPPNQALSMADALNAKQIPYAHVTYPEEAHGFRLSETIIHSLEAELEFYQRVMNLAEPSHSSLTIHHL